MEPQTGEGIRAGADTRYLVVVGGLLVVIVVTLGALWLRERRNSRGYRRMLIETQRNAAARGRLQAALGTMLGGQGSDAALRREDLPAETVTWNGRPRAVLRIGAAAGRRIGLRPGDALVVAEEPTTATAPSTAPAPEKGSGPFSSGRRND